MRGKGNALRWAIGVAITPAGLRNSGDRSAGCVGCGTVRRHDGATRARLHRLPRRTRPQRPGWLLPADCRQTGRLSAAPAAEFPRRAAPLFADEAFDRQPRRPLPRPDCRPFRRARTALRSAGVASRQCPPSRRPAAASWSSMATRACDIPACAACHGATADRRCAIHSRAARLAGRLSERAARRLAQRQSPSRRARLHGADHATAELGRYRSRFSLACRSNPCPARSQALASTAALPAQPADALWQRRRQHAQDGAMSARPHARPALRRRSGARWLLGAICASSLLLLLLWWQTIGPADDAPAAGAGYRGGGAWRVSGPNRQLRRLPYKARWRSICRRPRHSDRVRHRLLVEHHARCRNRYRCLVEPGVLARNASRPLSRRPSAVPGISLSELHPDQPRRQRCHCWPICAAWRRCGSPIDRHDLRFPYDTRDCAGGLAAAVLPVRRPPRRSDAASNRGGRGPPPWQRGAYLVNGLGHCSACHAKRNFLGGSFDALQSRRRDAARSKAGWRRRCGTMTRPGSATGQHSRSSTLLTSGQAARASVQGPMAEVVFSSTRHLSPTDAEAVAVYLKSIGSAQSSLRRHRVGRINRTRRNRCARPSLVQRPLRGLPWPARRRCARCLSSTGRQSLAAARPARQCCCRSSFTAASPPATAGNPRPFGMPPFGIELSQAEIAALMTYLARRLGPSRPR